MDIREDSKKIIRMLLTTAVNQGNLMIDFTIDFGKIAQELELKDANYCRVCFMYLSGKDLIALNKARGYVHINAAAIDFLAEI